MNCAGVSTRGTPRRLRRAIARATIAVAALATMLFVAAGVHAAAVDTGTVLRDPDFGVESRALGLRRSVEMLQWQAGEGGDALAWSEKPLPHAVHANPERWPLRGDAWLAGRVRVDGHEVDDAVVAALARWEPLAPREDLLPDALAATFVPAGDYLTTAQAPEAPQPGDLRVRWDQLVLPPLVGRVVERDGRWVLAPESGADFARTSPASRPIPAWRLLMPFAGALACVLLVFAWRRRRRAD